MSPKTWGCRSTIFVDQAPHDVVDREVSGFLSHAGVEDRLEQQVAQLALQLPHVLPLDCVGDLVGFLDRVRRDRLEGLLDIPWAARPWRPQPSH